MPAPALDPRPAHMGSGPSRSSGLRLAFAVAGLVFTGLVARRTRPSGPIKIVALGDSLTAGYQLRGSAALPGAARTGAEGQGPRRRGRQRRRLRRHHLRRPGAARLVGAGGHRRGDPRTRRQRHAARRRSQGHARGAGGNRTPPEGAPHRGAAVRHAGRAEFGRGLWSARSMRSIRSLPRRTISCSIRFSWMASWPIPSSIRATACIRQAAGVATIVVRHLAQGRGADRAGARETAF